MSDNNNNIRELEKRLDGLLSDGMNSITSFIEKEGGLRRDKKKNTILIEDYFIRDDGSVEINKVFSERQFKFLVNAWENKYPILVGILYSFLILLNLRLAYSFFNAVKQLDLSLLNLQAWSLCSITLFSVLLWLFSTAFDYWNYYNKKFFGFYLVFGTIVLRGMALLFSIFYQIFIPMVSTLEVTELMTPNKLAGLGWLSTIVPAAVIVIVLLISTIRGLRKEKNMEALKAFKIKHHISLPRDPFDYDVNVVRDMNDGKYITIPQHDRWMHGAVVGATGTAKTSSTLLPMINGDIDMKVKNEDAQKKAVYKLIKEGKAYISKPFKDEEYLPSLINTVILPVPGYEKLFKKKVLRYKSAGVTVLAPDPSLPDDVCSISEKKGFFYNRIDPIRNEDGTLKPGSKGFNPLYISPSIPKWAYRKEMVKRATLTADVMQIMFEMSGKSDPYFSSVNRIATTTICMLVMLAHERVFPGQKPKISHVRDIISNFENINKYMPVLNSINRENNGVYTPLITILQKQFIGGDAETFEKHCNGLRIQFHNFLENPEIERILCADDTVDMDLMLEEGQITTINIELGDLGPVNSPCFGLFLTVSFINAILRRKGTEWTRNPHFWYVDELPVVVNPSMESCFTLFRKFRVGMCVALQTMNQFDKTPFLSYLRGVVLNSCGFHVVFGRTNIDDQDIYSALGGMVDKVIEQIGSSSTALSTENPSFSKSERYTTQQVARVSTDKIRNKDFQEVTFYMVKDGRPLPPKEGKVNFLRKIDKMQTKRYRIDWEKLYNSDLNKKAEVNYAIDSEVLDLPNSKINIDTYTSVASTVVGGSGSPASGNTNTLSTISIGNTSNMPKSNEDIVKQIESMISQVAVTKQEDKAVISPIIPEATVTHEDSTSKKGELKVEVEVTNEVVPELDTVVTEDYEEIIVPENINSGKYTLGSIYDNKEKDDLDAHILASMDSKDL